MGQIFGSLMGPTPGPIVCSTNWFRFLDACSTPGVEQLSRWMPFSIRTSGAYSTYLVLPPQGPDDSRMRGADPMPHAIGSTFVRGPKGPSLRVCIRETRRRLLSSTFFNVVPFPSFSLFGSISELPC